MVLATKSKNTNVFVKFLAITLSVVLMALAFRGVFRAGEYLYYYNELDIATIADAQQPQALSDSTRLRSQLYDCIYSTYDYLQTKNIAEVEKALKLQKENFISEALDAFTVEKEGMDNTETFNYNYYFDNNAGSGIQLDIHTVAAKGAPQITYADSVDAAKEKLGQIFDFFVEKQLYKDSLELDIRTYDMKYYLKDTQNNLTVTNFEDGDSVDTVLEHEYAFVAKNGVPTFSAAFENIIPVDEKTGTNEVFEENVEYYFFVDEELDCNGSVMMTIRNLSRVSSYDVKKDVLTALGTFFASLVLAVYAFVVCGKKQKNGKVKRAWMDYIPTDIHLALSAAVIIGLGAVIFAITEAVAGAPDVKSYMHQLITARWICAGLIWAAFIEFMTSFIRVCKSEKKIYDNCALYLLAKYVIVKPCAFITKKIWQFAKNFFAYKPQQFKHTLTRYLIVYGIIDFLLFIIDVACAAGDASGGVVFVTLLLALFNAAIIAYGVWYSVQLDKIITAAHLRQTPQVEYDKLPQSLKTLVDSINYTSQELQAAVNKAVRDERMRTELITNVSHDLKTPLTSIINYVDLLDNCNIEDTTAKEYIAVLSEKSSTLKRLIDDLIEASKITSGVISINAVNLNLNELAAQVIVDSQKKFEDNRLELIFKGDKKNVGAFADGNKTYRIIENLLSNACKYSATGTRVYADVYDTENFSVFEIKNTSAAPLDISAEELKERFVRGDKSRANEGSGLGLSIADNLCKAQGGRLNITIDGDLFKAQVLLPKAK